MSPNPPWKFQSLPSPLAPSMLESAAASRRPAMLEPAASTSTYTSGRSSGFPDWVLLDLFANMGRCRRVAATTAVAATSSGFPIEVSFDITDPPALTRCPELPEVHFLRSQPMIATADGAFLLISVFFPNPKHPARSHAADLFVYRSGGDGPGDPSLELLPRPYPIFFLHNAGVLSRCDRHCLVADPERRFDADERMGYDLHVFSTMTKSWSTKAARLAPGMEPHGGRFDPTKAFAVAGGSMAWVDLRHGIISSSSTRSPRKTTRRCV